MKLASILIVDDDEAICRAIQSALRSDLYQIRAAVNVQSGLELALAEFPTLLLLDINLPDGTGWGLLTELREQRPLVKFQVVLMSSMRVSRAELKAHDIARFISKPFDMAYLSDVVNELLS